MSLHDIAERAAEKARALKEAQVAEAAGEKPESGGPARTDIRAVIEGFRGTEMVVVMIPARIHRDDALAAARWAALGFECDTIAMTTEAWHPAEEFTRRNPITGESWGAGEMQQVAESHDGLARGWLVENLSTWVVNRAGDVIDVCQDYRISRSGYGKKTTRYEIEWIGEPMFSDTLKAQVMGLIPESLVRYMNAPSAGHFLAQAGLSFADFNLDHEEGRAHADCAIVKALPVVGFQGAVLLQADTEKRRAIIEESLGDQAMPL